MKWIISWSFKSLHFFNIDVHNNKFKRILINSLTANAGKFAKNYKLKRGAPCCWLPSAVFPHAEEQVWLLSAMLVVLGRILFQGRALPCSMRINPGKPLVCWAINLCGVGLPEGTQATLHHTKVPRNTEAYQRCQVAWSEREDFLLSYVWVFHKSFL